MQSNTTIDDAWFYVTDIFLKTIRPKQSLISTKIDLGNDDDLSITIVCEDEKNESHTIVISREYYNLSVKKICEYLMEAIRNK